MKKTEPGDRAAPPGASPRRKRLPSREGTILTTIALPRALHREASLAALNRNWSLMEVLRVALAEWLAREGSPRKPGGGARG